MKVSGTELHNRDEAISKITVDLFVINIVR